MRTVNRVASGLLGLVLIAAGVLLTGQFVASLTGWRLAWPPIAAGINRLSQTALADWRVLAVSIVAVLVGGLIVLAQAWPRRPAILAADPPWWVTRSWMERRVAAAARTLPGITGVRTSVRGRPERWRLGVEATAGLNGQSTVDGPPVDEQSVERLVREELARLSVHADVPVATTVRRRQP